MVAYIQCFGLLAETQTQHSSSQVQIVIAYSTTIRASIFVKPHLVSGEITETMRDIMELEMLDSTTGK